jgi:zinc transport system ATP-binding protein
MEEKIVEADNVTVRYGHSVILDNVSLEVRKGDVLGIVGPNGGGKTTLVNAILGNAKLASGNVRLFGQDLSGFKDFDKIGYVAQNAIQFDPIFPATVREIVTLGCLSRKTMGRRLRKEDHESVRKAMELVGIDEIAGKKISNLSGGQKQRIFIAKALVRNPELLILDEATSGLDVCIQDRFISTLHKLRAEMGVTVITVSHDLSGVMCQANKLAVVSRQLHFAEIRPGMDPTAMLREAYGEHFTFVFHHDGGACANH